MFAFHTANMTFKYMFADRYSYACTDSENNLDHFRTIFDRRLESSF